MKVTDEGRFLSSSMMTKVKNTLVKGHLWTNRVAIEIVLRAFASRHWRSVAQGACDCSARRTEFAPRILPAGYLWNAVSLETSCWLKRLISVAKKIENTVLLVIGFRFLSSATEDDGHDTLWLAC